MTTFFAGGMADVLSTEIGLQVGLNEAGIMGKSHIEAGRGHEAYMVRIAVTAVLIGLYALSKKHGGRWEFPLDKAIRIGNLITWGADVLNVVQIAHTIR